MARVLSSLIFSVFLCMVSFAQAAEFKKGENYFELSAPVKYEPSDKIEVIMFLWYGCSGCYKLDSKILAWAEKLPGDVDFKRLPAQFFPDWQFHARVYLTMQALGATYEQHHAVFDYMQKDKLPLENEGDLPPFIEKMGLDKDRFMAVFTSDALTEKLDTLQFLVGDAHIAAVPAMLINGRYSYTLKNTDAKHFIELADYLINLERQRQAR